jgi:hypothetical protein
VFACINTCGAIGGTLSGLVIGWLLKYSGDTGEPTASGWNIVFMVTAVEYLLAAACWILIDPRKPIGSRSKS